MLEDNYPFIIKYKIQLSLNKLLFNDIFLAFILLTTKYEI